MMNLYSALLCIVVHPKRFTIMCVCGGGVSPQPPPVCSIHLEKKNIFQNMPFLFLKQLCINMFWAKHSLHLVLHEQVNYSKTVICSASWKNNQLTLTDNRAE